MAVFQRSVVGINPEVNLQRIARLQGMFERFAVDRQIVGMNELAVRFEARHEIPRLYAENPIGFLRPPDTIGLQIPFPASDNGELLGLVQLFEEFRFFAVDFFHFGRRAAAIGNVVGDS